MLEITTVCEVEGCYRPHFALKKCNMHWQRIRKTGDVGDSQSTVTAKGLPLRWVEGHKKYSLDDCLEWPFAKNHFGTAVVHINNTSCMVARIMCAEKNGPAPSLKHRAMRTCKSGVSCCVNPNHLMWQSKKTIEEIKDRIRNYHQIYYQQNAEKTKERTKKWKGENSERVNVLHSANYHKNGEERRGKWRTNSAKCRKENPLQHLLNLARGRAKTRGIEFSITVVDLTLPSHCPLLGIPLDTNGLSYDNKPSIDRIDNKKGYIPGNVIIVCQRANRIKSDATAAELTLMAVNLTRIEGGVHAYFKQ